MQSGPVIDWPAVVLFLRREYGSLPDLSATLSTRLKKQVGRHRLQAMVSEQWQPHWQPAWDVGNELLAMEREVREHDSERAA